MLAAVALLASIREMKLPNGAMCPDALVRDEAVVAAYGDGKNANLITMGRDLVLRINSTAGTVASGGERGAKIALADSGICAAWQGDYRQGPHVWFSRMNGGKFEPQRDLLDGKTPGIDHPAIAASGPRVVVLWLDGRGGQDKQAPVTSTIWYTLSSDEGKTFGPNRNSGIRACACCSFSPSFDPDGSLTITYRGGNENVRDIWRATGDLEKDRWTVKPLTSTGWKFEGCPMDGPRAAGTHFAYLIDGKCYADGKLLGPGKYANVSRWGLATWQEGQTLVWKDLISGRTGSMACGVNRAAVAELPDGSTVVVH